MSLIAAPAIALAIGLAPTASNATDTIHTPIVMGPGNLVAIPCTSYYKTVTLSITDDGVLLNGAPAPKCIRVKTTATLKISNNAEADATVTFDGDTNVMVPSELWNYSPVGAYFAAGENLTFSVDELAGSSMSIQVF
jgi:hypothetical protein